MASRLAFSFWRVAGIAHAAQGDERSSFLSEFLKFYEISKYVIYVPPPPCSSRTYMCVVSYIHVCILLCVCVVCVVSQLAQIVHADRTCCLPQTPLGRVGSGMVLATCVRLPGARTWMHARSMPVGSGTILLRPRHLCRGRVLNICVVRKCLISLAFWGRLWLALEILNICSPFAALGLFQDHKFARNYLISLSLGSELFHEPGKMGRSADPVRCTDRQCGYQGAGFLEIACFLRLSQAKFPL